MTTKRQPIWLVNRAFRLGSMTSDRFNELIAKEDLILRVDNKGVVWGVPRALIKHWDE